MKPQTRQEQLKSKRAKLKKTAKAQSKPESMGQNLRQLRKDRGFSILEVSRMTKCDASELARIESDEREIDSELLNKLAELYHVPIKKLLQYQTKLKFPQGLVQCCEKYGISTDDASDLLKVSDTIRGAKPVTATEWKELYDFLRKDKS